MQSHEIEDVLNLSAILAPIYTDQAPPVATLISNLIAWRDHSLPTVEPLVLKKPEPVAAQPKPSAPLLPPPEPSAEQKWEQTTETKAPVKAAPKAKGRAKPPPVAEPTPDPSSDDDF